MEKIKFKKNNKTTIKIVTACELGEMIENGWEIDNIIEVYGAYNE